MADDAVGGEPKELKGKDFEKLATREDFRSWEVVVKSRIEAKRGFKDILSDRDANVTPLHHDMVVGLLLEIVKIGNAVTAIRRVKASNSDAKGYDAWQALHRLCLGASEEQRKRNLWKEFRRPCVNTETYEDYHSHLSATALALDELGESVKDDTLKNALVAGIEDDPRLESTV